jgi:hypothetical protein
LSDGDAWESSDDETTDRFDTREEVSRGTFRSTATGGDDDDDENVVADDASDAGDAGERVHDDGDVVNVDRVIDSSND